MKKRKLDSGPRYFYALFIGVSLLLFGFAISNGLHAFEFERVSSLQEQVYYDFFETEISYELFDETTCDLEVLEELGESLGFQGSMIEQFEEKFGPDNEYVIKRKRYYYLLELAHFKFMKQINEDCNLDHDFILFFYSNKEDHLEDSQDVGKILSHIKKTNPSVLIYSFDSHSNDTIIKDLRSFYEIEADIFILINEKHRLGYGNTLSQFEQYL